MSLPAGVEAALEDAGADGVIATGLGVGVRGTQAGGRWTDAAFHSGLDDGVVAPLTAVGLVSRCSAVIAAVVIQASVQPRVQHMYMATTTRPSVSSFVENQSHDGGEWPSATLVRSPTTAIASVPAAVTSVAAITFSVAWTVRSSEGSQTRK